ncbi:hypothetical protein NKH18_10140 [Streptomyces sp. M10(2022)]
MIAEIDLRVTELLESPPAATAAPAADVRTAQPAERLGTLAAGVPGVVALTRELGTAVHTGADHIRIELATSRDHRALDVGGRSVRRCPGPPRGIRRSPFWSPPWWRTTGTDPRTAASTGVRGRWPVSR